jgi:hypothetical protein
VHDVCNRKALHLGNGPDGFFQMQIEGAGFTDRSRYDLEILMEVLHATDEIKPLIENVAIDGARPVTTRNKIVAPPEAMIVFDKNIIAEFLMVTGERNALLPIVRQA